MPTIIFTRVHRYATARATTRATHHLCPQLETVVAGLGQHQSCLVLRPEMVAAVRRRRVVFALVAAERQQWAVARHGHIWDSGCAAAASDRIGAVAGHTLNRAVLAAAAAHIAAGRVLLEVAGHTVAVGRIASEGLAGMKLLVGRSRVSVKSAGKAGQSMVLYQPTRRLHHKLLLLHSFWPLDDWESTYGLRLGKSAYQRWVSHDCWICAGENNRL